MADVVYTIKSSGGDYSTTIAWEADLPADMPSDGNVQYGDVYGGGWDANNNQTLTISGHVTDATYNPTLRAASGEGAFLVWDASKARMYRDGSTAVIINDLYCSCIGMQVNVVNAATDYGIQIYPTSTTSSEITILNNIVHIEGSASDTLSKGIFVAASVSNYIYIFQNTVYRSVTATGTSQYGIYGYDSPNCLVFNNTVYGFNRNYGRCLSIINNISQGANSADYYSSGSTASANNIDEDGSGEITDTLTFNNLAGWDFHLDSTDTSAINAGTDESAYFTTDPEGDSRTGGSYFGIGADFFATSGTTYDETGADSGAAGDTASGALSVEGAAADSGAVDDSASGALTADASAADSGAVDDSASATVEHAAVAADSADAGDAASGALSMDESAEDSGDVGDSVTSDEFAESVGDSATVSDEVAVEVTYYAPPYVGEIYDPTPLAYTGDFPEGGAVLPPGWDPESSVWLRHSIPLPFTVQAIVVEGDLSD